MAHEYRLTDTTWIIRTADELMFPPDPENADYIAYQEWIAAGNVPDPSTVSIPGAQYSWGPTLAEVVGKG